MKRFHTIFLLPVFPILHFRCEIYAGKIGRSFAGPGASGVGRRELLAQGDAEKRRTCVGNPLSRDWAIRVGCLGEQNIYRTAVSSNPKHEIRLGLRRSRHGKR